MTSPNLQNTYQRAVPTPRDLSVLAWLRLVRVFQKVEGHTAKKLREANVSLAQFDVLANVAASEGLTQQELANALLVTKGNVCQLLGKIEDAGLIRRQQEGRINRLFLTDEGRQLIQNHLPDHQSRLIDCFGTLTMDERQELIHALRAVERRVDCLTQSDQNSAVQ